MCFLSFALPFFNVRYVAVLETSSAAVEERRWDAERERKERKLCMRVCQRLYVCLSFSLTCIFRKTSL